MILVAQIKITTALPFTMRLSNDQIPDLKKAFQRLHNLTRSICHMMEDIFPENHHGEIKLSYEEEITVGYEDLVNFRITLPFLPQEETVELTHIIDQDFATRINNPNNAPNQSDHEFLATHLDILHAAANDFTESPLWWKAEQEETLVPIKQSLIRKVNATYHHIQTLRDPNNQFPEEFFSEHLEYFGTWPPHPLSEFTRLSDNTLTTLKAKTSTAMYRQCIHNIILWTTNSTPTPATNPADPQTEDAGDAHPADLRDQF